MPELTIRAAVAADLPAITAIYEEAVLHGTATFEIEPPNLAEMTRRYEALASAGFPYFVAVDGDQVLGYAYAGSYRPRIAYRFTVENSIYLAPAAQRRGIGSRLLATLIESCAAKGFRQMVAVIGDSANAGSIAVHRNAGFEMVGTNPNVGFKFGRWLDTVSMQKALGDGGETLP
ncbi:GNAT family N-acetyltransferase [Tardiphaga sp.]|jgi:L-amino acid N-acyltransferase YncA|uniref:GNAT family N-acetyltransferase n=1 Tax=Tardiphaga sp. TaxID=1926292 RepID=UPI0037DA26B5